MEEVVNLKKGIKLAFEQLTYDFEDCLKNMKEDAKKQHIETTKVLTDIQKKITEGKTTTKSSSKSSVKPKVSIPAASSSSSDAPSDIPHTATFSAHSLPKEHCKPKHHLRTAYQCKPRVLFMGDSLAHNSKFREIEIVTNTTIKTAKSYSSAWDKSARYK